MTSYRSHGPELTPDQIADRSADIWDRSNKEVIEPQEKEDKRIIHLTITKYFIDVYKII